MFNGLFIPEGLARCRWIRAGAKLAWGRLARYAGEDGHCYPTMKALGLEVGVGERQAQKYVKELERARLLRRNRRFAAGAQMTNSFEFLWHELFDTKAKNSPAERVNDKSPGGTNDSSPKESQPEESHSLNVLNADLDYMPRSRKKSAPKPSAKPPSVCQQYPKVRERLALYMQMPGDDKEYPTDRMVVDIMDAVGTDDEEEVIAALNYFENERGLKPNTKHGPRSFAWFKTVLQDHFTKKRDRESVANPSGYHEWKDRNEARLGTT